MSPQSEENALGWFYIIKIGMGKMKEKVSFQITLSIGLIEGNAIKSLLLSCYSYDTMKARF